MRDDNLTAMLNTLITGKDFTVIEGIIEWLKENSNDIVRHMQLSKFLGATARFQQSMKYSTKEIELFKEDSVEDGQNRNYGIKRTERRMYRAWTEYLDTIDRIFCFDFYGLAEVIGNCSLITSIVPPFDKNKELEEKGTDVNMSEAEVINRGPYTWGGNDLGGSD